jgi:hypothetical protein
MPETTNPQGGQIYCGSWFRSTVSVPLQLDLEWGGASWQNHLLGETCPSHGDPEAKREDGAGVPQSPSRAQPQ